MKIKKKVQDALNEQINAELSSAYLYLSMAAYFEGKNLGGMASWMKKQASEEVEHAMKFYSFIQGRAGDVTLKAIPKPKATWKNPLEAFEDSYKHEQFVTSLIDKLVDLAVKEKDNATQVMLNWFVDEQVEEENQVLEIVEKLRMIKDAPAGLFIIDRELAQRK